MNKNGTEPIVSIEKVVQYAIVVRLWSNHGRKVPQHPKKVPHKQKKALKTNGFQGFDGGDKRDRTADLLNAMDCPRAVGCRGRLTAKKLLIFNTFSAWGA